MSCHESPLKQAEIQKEKKKRRRMREGEMFMQRKRVRGGKRSEKGMTNNSAGFGGEMEQWCLDENKNREIWGGSAVFCCTKYQNLWCHILKINKTKKVPQRVP